MFGLVDQYGKSVYPETVISFDTHGTYTEAWSRLTEQMEKDVESAAYFHSPRLLDVYGRPVRSSSQMQRVPIQLKYSV